MESMESMVALDAGWCVPRPLWQARFDAGVAGHVHFRIWWRSTRWPVHARTGRHRAVAQLARVPVSKTGGWGFESLLPCAYGP